MGYNQGLAVGLAIGIPVFLVLVGAYVLLVRHRRLQRQEDAQGGDIDVELQDNNLFKEFGEALHRPYDQRKLPRKLKEFASESLHTAEEKRTPLLTPDLAELSRELLLLRTASKHLTTPTPLVANAGQGRTTPILATSHQKTPLAYAFYDTFIPILPGQAEQQVQPPHMPGADRHSVHSLNGSLIGGNASSLSRLLDNLAKQLQGPQFFEKLPLRAGTTKLRPAFQLAPANNSSSDVVHNILYDSSAINDNYVHETGSPRQRHPYREWADKADKTDTAEIGNLQNNFDNNITADTDFDAEQPDVVFK